MGDKLKEPKRPQKNKKEKTKETKREKVATLLFLLKDPHSYSIVIFVLHRDYHSCITMWGPLHYRTWFAYSNDEPPQMSSRSSWANKLDAPPLVSLEILP